MASEEQAPEHRPPNPDQHGANIFWHVSGPVLSSETAAPAEPTVETFHQLPVPDNYEDHVDVSITSEELQKSGIPDGQYVALAPGQDLKLTSDLNFHESHRQAIFVGRGELVVQDHIHGFHKLHFKLPNSQLVTGDSRILSKIVVANIRKKAIGWRSLGTHLILFLDSGDQVVTRLDSSVDYGYNSKDTWEFHLDALAQLCSAAGIAFESETYETARQFLAEKPQWAPPKLEFEVDHLPEELVREWGLAIALALPISCGLLAVVGGALLWFGPVGWAIESLEGAGTLVAVVLTIWSHSRWRMKRSLSRRRPGSG
jgi:hypothetical protein